MNRVPLSYVALGVTLQSFVHNRVEDCKDLAQEARERRDRGVTGMEYAALILVAAAVIGVLITLVNDNLEDEVKKAFNKLFQIEEETPTKNKPNT